MFFLFRVMAKGKHQLDVFVQGHGFGPLKGKHQLDVFLFRVMALVP